MDQVLNTQVRTRERFGKGPFSTQEVGRAALRPWVLPLAEYLQRKSRLGALSRSFAALRPSN